MVLIHCSVTGTALSWYIPLIDTYEQDWRALYKLLENNFHRKKNFQVEALNVTKRTMKQYANLHLKSNSWLKKAGVMRRMHLPFI